MVLLINVVGNRLISRFRDILWPSGSPDFSVCDILLWNYLKHRVYQAKEIYYLRLFKRTNHRGGTDDNSTNTRSSSQQLFQPSNQYQARSRSLLQGSYFLKRPLGDKMT